MTALIIAILAALALLAYEAWQIVHMRPTITAQARDLMHRQPGMVALIMLGLGILLGHLWLC